MATTPAICNAAKLKALQLITAPSDVIKLALYTASATLGAGTAAYTATGEVTGSGYTAGGVAVTHATAAALLGNVAVWTPSASIVFPTLVLDSPVAGALLYNATQGVALQAFSVTTQPRADEPFILRLPANDASNALLRWN